MSFNDWRGGVIRDPPYPRGGENGGTGGQLSVVVVRNNQESRNSNVCTHFVAVEKRVD